MNSLFPPGHRLVTEVAAVVLCVCAFAYGRTPADNSFFTSFSVSRHLRTGTIEFDGGRTEEVAPEPLVSFGLSTGKNYRLSEQLRLMLPIVAEYGFAKEEDLEHLYLDDGTDPPAHLNTVLITAGVEPQLQVPLRLTEKSWGFAFVGGGLHYCMSHEEEWTQDDRHLLVDDPYLERGNHIAWSVVAGGGLEKTFSRGRGFFLRYLFRFWYPIKRKTNRDNLFPLEGKPYYERFFTHSFAVGYMVPRLF